MSAKEDTIALLKDAISTHQENLLNGILNQLSISELKEETYQSILSEMKNSNIEISINAGSGNKNFIAYTMDLTKEYIEINADYRS